MEAVQHEAPRSIGRYMLYREVASGGMATVHIGRLRGPAGFARTVAIKRLHPPFARDPDFVSMFLDEARLAARIQHPNVVSVLDVVAAEKELFLVMDYVQGESLSALLKLASKTEVGVPRRIFITILCGMLSGLDAAHEACGEEGQPLEIVHRDVSPQNVLLGLDGVPRVLDFGVAKAALRIHWSTKDGQLKGKIGYMPPEQINSGLVDRRADIYAAGVMLWEGLTGQRLFDTKNTDLQVVIGRVLASKIPPPSTVVPGISKALDDVVAKATAGNRRDRYATARDMLVALEKVMPPATTRHVGEWVSQVAGAELRARAVDLTKIEKLPLPATVSSPNHASVSGLSPESSGSLRGAPSGSEEKRGRERLHSGQDLSGFVPRPAPPPEGDEEEVALDSAGPVEGEPVDKAPLLSDRPPAEALSRTLRAWWYPWVALLGLGGTGIVAFMMLRRPAGTPAVAPSSSAPIALVAPHEDPDLLVPPVPTVAEPATADATESARSAAPSATAPAAHSARRPSLAPKANCDPPFTTDPDGVRIPKRECFR